MIYEIRGKQVILDSDVAYLYNVETKRINEAVKNNIERFPENFCFRLTEEEFKSSRSKFSTLKTKRGQHRKYLPYAFTEQGIAMLLCIIKNKIAIETSLVIMNAFVEMRKFISNNLDIFNRMVNVEYKILKLDDKVNKILEEMNPKEFKQNIFFNGQVYEAYSLLINIIRQVKKKIIIIDNYIDKTIFDILLYKEENVDVEIYTKDIKTHLDVDKFNFQNPNVIVNKTNNFHDRFIIIDDKTIYHVGASLKDLGKKCFAINKMDNKFIEIVKKVI